MIELSIRATSLSGIELAPESEVEHDVSPPLLSAVEQALLGGETHYTVRPGVPELRRKIAAKIQRAGGPEPDAGDPADNVLITSGESESLFVALLGLDLYAGDVCAALKGPCPHEDLFRLFDLKLKSEKTRETKLFYRQAGAERALQVRLIDLAGRVETPDILDLGSESPAHFPPTNPDRTLIVGNLNALPGLTTFRVAYLMGPKAMLVHCQSWKRAFSICSAAPSQRAAIVTLEEAAS